MPNTKETKTCPFCGEEILAVAIKCKHCGSDLSAVIAASRAEALRNDLKNTIAAVIAELSSVKTKKLFFAPNIPSDKVATSKEKYARRLSAQEEILILGEAKAMGFFLCGFVLTNQAFHYFGVNNYQNVIAGSRKGVVPLHQIRSMQFKEGSLLGGYDHFVLNGMGPDESDLIPKYFDIGEEEREFMQKLFLRIQGILDELAGEIERAQPQQATVSVVPPRTRKASKTDNPVEAGEKPKPGCFKKGCLAIIGLIALALGIWALISGLMS